MRGIACLFLLFNLQLCFNGPAQSIKITLLGPGVPQPSIERFGPAALVETGYRYFLFDCGRSAAHRIWQQKIPIGKVNRLFLRHLLSDHTWYSRSVADGLGIYRIWSKKDPISDWHRRNDARIKDGV